MTTQTVYLTYSKPRYGYVIEAAGTCVPDRKRCKIMLPIEKMAPNTEIWYQVVKVTKQNDSMQQDVIWGPHRMQGTSHEEIQLRSSDLMECYDGNTSMHAQYIVNQGASMEAQVRLGYY